MKNEKIAIEILRDLVRSAAQTIINDKFERWHDRYHNYRSCCAIGHVAEAGSQLDRLNGCFEEGEIKKIFDEVEESYRAEVDPKVWALFKDDAEPAASDRPEEHPGECGFWG